MENKNDKQIEPIDFAELVKMCPEQPFRVNGNNGRLVKAIKQMQCERIVAQGLLPIIPLVRDDFKEVRKLPTKFDFVEASAETFDECMEKLQSKHEATIQKFAHAIFHIVASEKVLFEPSDIKDFTEFIERNFPKTNYIYGVTRDPFDEVGFKIQALVYNIKPTE